METEKVAITGMILVALALIGGITFYNTKVDIAAMQNGYTHVRDNNNWFKSPAN